MKLNQPVKSIPNIRSQYYVPPSVQYLQSQKISKNKSAYIEETKGSNLSYFQFSAQQPKIKYSTKRVNVSLDQQKIEELQQLPPLRKEILRSRQSQPSVATTKSKLMRPSSPMLSLEQLPQIDQSRTSQGPVGVVSAYAANTHQGLVRPYNEDRVSIILNLMRPPHFKEKYWPQSSFFAVYDGHGGAQCADYMRDNLHQFIVKEDSFPSNPKLAMERGFQKAERQYIELADLKTLDKSGCCAVVALIVDHMCFVANVGDSRAVLSQHQKAKTVTVDHKPNNQDEYHRIIKHGGEIYQTSIPNLNGEPLLGPHRVLPGRLAVSRTFGDAEAKLTKYGGIPNVISAEPDIFQFAIQDQDCLILACDGIYDKLTSEEVVQCLWTVNQTNVHQFCGRAAEAIMKLSLQKKTYDNITVVILAFPQLERRLKK